MIEIINNRLRRLDGRLLIFAILCLNYLSLGLNENEEEYFAFAKYFIDPGWIPDAISVSDISGTRIIFESIVGFALRHLSFEQTALIGRCIGAALLSLPLALIFRRLRFSNLSILLFMQVLCLFPHQSFFGKEWIFGAFETKTIAYVFVFYSIHALLEERHLKSILFAAMGVYFHILVGGWYAIVLFGYLLFTGIPVIRLIRYAALFVLITAPFLAYLGFSYLRDNPGVIDGVNINWVYVYFRNPHHLAPFNQNGEITGSFLRGIILSFFIFLLATRAAISRKGEDIGKLALFFVVTFLQQTLFIVLAYFDKNGDLLKFYPFRSSALSFFSALLMLFIAAESAIEKASPNRQRAMQKGIETLFLAVVIGLGVNLSKNLRKSYDYYFPTEQETARRALHQWIAGNTPQNAKFFNLNQRKREDLDFVRQTGRDRFSVYKFVPTDNKMIFDWYQRVLEKEKVKKNPAYLAELTKRYRIDYVVSPTTLSHPGMKLVYANDYYHIYAL